MLVVLMALKTLELRARRDALVVFFLGFFLVLTHFLYSQSLAGGAGHAGLGVGSADRAGAGPHAGGPPVAGQRRRGGRAGGTAGRAGDDGAVPAVPAHVAAVGHAGGRRRPHRAVGQLAHGRRGRRSPTTTIAMRVRFFGRAPDPSELYFRGPVLGSFDGREWTAGAAHLPGRRSGRGPRCSCSGAGATTS
jgi:hypothetical protein